MNLIEKILKESEAYTSFELIQSSIEKGGDLAHFPVQPLYVAMRGLGEEKVASLLPLLSQRQRQAFYDLDLWNRDELDTQNFEFWIKAHALCQEEEILNSFVDLESFALYLKGRFNIWTFDVEDPEYPDHDHYFLTEDNLLLFEFDEDFELVSEVKTLVKGLYSKLGVEKAYAFLFKLTADSFMVWQEEAYQDMKYRQAELGFVDYYDAVQIEGPFNKLALIEADIAQKKKIKTPNIDDVAKKQALHFTSLVAYKNDFDFMSEELSKVTHGPRQEYLRFNFLRLVNATITFHQALREGQVALTRVGRLTKAYMHLGYDYLQSKKKTGELDWGEESSLFDQFDFIDLYRYGKSLVMIIQSKMNHQLTYYQFSTDQDAPFLGRFFNDFIDESFECPPKFSRGIDRDSLVIDSFQTYMDWSAMADTLIDAIPFIDKFHDVYCEMRDSGKILDHYYINYQVSEIDFESVLISSFANYLLGHYEDEAKGHKMGLTLNDFRQFVAKLFDENGELKLSEENFEHLDSFINKYGLENILNFREYLIHLLKDHLEGHDFAGLSENDYKHVGGPIILDPGQ